MNTEKHRVRAVSVRQSHVLLGLMVIAISCRGDGETSPPDGVQLVQSAVTTTASLSISLPQTVAAESVALGASRSLVISTSDNVIEAFAGAATVTNTGQQQTVVSSSSRVGDLWSDAIVQLGPNARIEGTLRTTRFVQQDPTAVITEGLVAQAVVSAPFLTTWNISYESAASNDVTVNSGQTRTLAPGRYHNVRVNGGGTLRLSAGEYVFTTLKNLAGGKVFVHNQSGPIRTYVLSELVSEGSVKIGDGDHGKFLIGYLGSAPAHIRSPFTGTVVAPNGKTTVAPGAPQADNVHTGAFFGLDLEVSPGTTIVHVGYKDWGGFTAPACNDPNLASRIPAPFKLQDFFNLCPQGRLPRLEPPISAGESATIRDGFSWPATTPVRNFTAEGPAYYYALIYVEDRADLEALDELRIHHDTLPLFAEEREKWAGLTGTLSPQFDGEGAFVFAIIPGLTYNLLREAALCADPANAEEVFRVIQLRDIPNPDARNPDGSLSYRFLAQEGFRYRGLPNCPDAEMETAAGDEEAVCDPAVMNPPPGGDPEVNAVMAATNGSGLPFACTADSGGGQPFRLSLGKRLKRLAKAAVSITKKIQDLGRRGLSGVSRFFKGSARLTVTLEMRNTDPGFGGQGSVMTRAWGANRGTPLPLEGVQVRALQQISFSFRVKIPSVNVGGFKTPNIISPPISGTIPFDALSTGVSNAQGVASFKVVRRSTTSICVKAENHAAVIMDWIFPQEACSFQTPILTAAQLTGDRAVTAPFQDKNLNILAQITDGHAYLRDVVHHRPKKAEVMVGRFANLFSSKDSDGNRRPYAPCFGYPNWRNPYGAILGTLLQQAGKTFSEQKLEPLIRKGAQEASEALDQASAAALRWGEARLAAAGTSAQAAVNTAADAAQAARDAAFTAQQQAAKAAQATADLAEAVRKLAALRRQNASGAAISAAEAAVVAATQASRDAIELAKTAADAARQSANTALTLANQASNAAVNTAAAVAAATAAAATKAASGLIQATGEVLAEGLTVAISLVGRAAGEILGEVLTDVIDLVLADVDIVMPDGPASLSRGVATHEYGHFVLCDLTYRTNPFQFGSAWTDAIASTVAKQALGQDQTFDEEAYINEGFADFIAAQVAGGVNYFSPVASFSQRFVDGAGNLVWPDGMSWCDAGMGAASRCIEDNFGGLGLGPLPAVIPLIPGTTAEKQVTRDQNVDGYNRQVARIASTLHDAFDGAPNTPAANLPGNGVAWTQFTPAAGGQQVVMNVMGNRNQVTPRDGLHSSTLHEEAVVLPGTALPRVIRSWLDQEAVLAFINERTFLGGLSSVMLNSNPATEVCRLYVNHQPGDTCPVVTCPSGQSFDATTGTCRPNIIID